MINDSATHPAPAGQRTILLAVFAVALALHFFLATRNWSSGFLIGQEFRQSMTALNCYYIDAQNNFTPRYETPVLGKPWVIPLEFPLYEWSVVGVSRLTGWPHFKSARTVSLGCFYLSLPAVFLLLGHCGVSPPRRLLVLALILTCPLYIFYARAFLMEAMELMFSVWFVTAFVRTMQRRRLAWLLLGTASGTGAALIKNTTFFVWLLPAAAYGAWCLWSDLRRRAGPRAISATLAWGLGSVLVPGAMLFWWIKFSDALKAANASALFMTSTRLSTDNFELYNLLYRVTPGNWRLLMARWNEGIMPPWVIGAVLALCLVVATERRKILLAVLFFLGGQSLFPNAYAHHDYYFFACAFFILAALGFGLLGLLDSKLPRWLCWLVVLVPLGAGLNTYRQSYYGPQNIVSQGGSHLTIALHDMLPKAGVIIVAGDDWSSVIPYYAQRRALMLRGSLEKDWPYIDRAFADLAGEDVAALVLIGDQRENRRLIEKAARAFSIDPIICFTHHNAAVYISSHHRPSIVQRLHDFNNYGELALSPQALGALPDQLKPVPPDLWETIFKNVTPKPTLYNFAIGLELSNLDGMEVIGAHPDATLWFTPPAGATEILWEFGIYHAAYEKDGDRTDGVDFIILEKRPDATEHELYRRTLDPVRVAADRGLQSVRLACTPAPGAQLAFMTQPHDNYAYDWAYWRKIQIK